jgi:hypothetical protein
VRKSGACWFIRPALSNEPRPPDHESSMVAIETTHPTELNIYRKEADIVYVLN